MVKRFRAHGVQLFLGHDLYLGFIKLQADKELGRSYAGLLAFTEGLYHLNYISKESYELFKKKYSQPLEKDEFSGLNPEEIEKAKKLKDLEKVFSEVVVQWPELSEKSKKAHVAKATKFLDRVSNAKLVLSLAYGELEE